MAGIKKDVVVLVGAGGIGTTVARRFGFGRKLLLTSRSQEKTDCIAKGLRQEGFDAEGIDCDLGSREDIVRVVERGLPSSR